MNPWYITTFYKFVELADPEAFKKTVEDMWAPRGLHTLMILAHEGINSTTAAPSLAVMNEFKTWLRQTFNTDFPFKDSQSDRIPFRKKMTIKIRPEIVTLQRPDLVPASERHNHLSAEEWEQAIREGATILDTRNRYETELGTFKGAVLPPIDEFSEFGEAVEKMNLPKDKKTLIFCTGGIRCEKAILQLEEQGFKNVYQLDGGILNYFENSRGEYWDGECFVFDNRVAVDKNLTPTKTYVFCPLCGDPAKSPITCAHCGKESIVCDSCITDLKAGGHDAVCSKNCRYHHTRLSGGRRSRTDAIEGADQKENRESDNGE